MSEPYQDPELHFLWMEVSDQARSVDFYRETLGFPVQETSGPFAIVHLGNTKLYLASGQPRGTGVHVAISVPDIDAIHQRLREHGLGLPAPVDQGWARFVELIDPDGYRLILLTTAEGKSEFKVGYPAHIQQPLIQTVVDDLLGVGHCPSSGESGARTTWVMDEMLAGYRSRQE